jgi:hypothetical protein
MMFIAAAGFSALAYAVWLPNPTPGSQEEAWIA